MYGVHAATTPGMGMHMFHPPAGYGGHSTHHHTDTRNDYQANDSSKAFVPKVISVSPITVTLYRQSPLEPWGFRIQGGKDFRMPLIVKKVGEKGSAVGMLHPGDGIVSIAGHVTKELTHSDAQSVIKNAGETMVMVVTRGTGMAYLGGTEQAGMKDLKPKGKIKFSASRAHNIMRR